MKTLLEVQAQLMPTLKACMKAYNSKKQLFALQEGMHKIQMAVMWINEAHTSSAADIDVSMDMVITNGAVSTKPEIVTIVLPTLIGTNDFLKYARSGLEKSMEALDLIGLGSENPKVQHQVLQATVCLQEALFNVKIATNQYEQLTAGDINNGD